MGAPQPSSPAHLPGAGALAPSSLGRALRRQLSACSLGLSPAGASAAAGALPAGPGLGAAPGVCRNLSRACCVLEADGVQAGALAGLAHAGLGLSLVWGAEGPCVARQGSGALRVTAGQGLAESRGPAGLPERTREGVVAGGSAAAGTKPLAVELPTTSSRVAGLALGPASLHPPASWAVCGALRGLESVGAAPGCLGAGLDSLGLASAAVGWWLEQTKTPGSAVVR